MRRFAVLILLVLLIAPGSALGRIDVRVTGPDHDTARFTLIAPDSTRSWDVYPDGTLTLNVPAGTYSAVMAADRITVVREIRVRDGGVTGAYFQTFQCPPPGPGISCRISH